MTRLSGDEIDRQLRDLPGWSRQGDAIVKRFEFQGFPEAVAFVNRLVPGAEAADHHPDLTITYGRVLVSYSTHSEGGITQQDIEGAKRTDEAAR